MRRKMFALFMMLASLPLMAQLQVTFVRSGSSTVANPTFSPVSPYTGGATNVTISDATPNAIIYYCTDAVNTCTPATQYTTPIAVSVTGFIRANAVLLGGPTSSTVSWSGTINPPAATPTFSPVAGTYATTQSVTISDTSPSPTITYCFDTNNTCTPVTTYSAPVSVSSNGFLRAQATASGFSASAIGSAQYTISASGHAVTLVQAQTGPNNSGGTSNSLAFASNMAAGNYVIACAVWVGSVSGATISSITDSQGKSYVVDSSTLEKFDGSTNYTEIGMECGHSTQTSNAVANTVTATITSSEYLTLFTFEVNPNGGALSLDQFAIATGNTTGSVSAGNITPSQANTFAVSGMVIDNGLGSTSLSAGSGWTADGLTGGGSAALGMEYQTLTGTATVGGTWTDSTAINWAANVANYKSN